MGKREVMVWVPGEPVPKARPRMTRNGHVYTPKRTADYEAAVKAAWRETGAEKWHEGDLFIHLYFYLPIPKGYSKGKAELAKAGEIRPCKKPDWDNLAKAVCDALNGLAYEDDKQITDARVSKRYGEKPGVLITIVEL